MSISRRQMLGRFVGGLLGGLAADRRVRQGLTRIKGKAMEYRGTLGTIVEGPVLTDAFGRPLDPAGPLPMLAAADAEIFYRHPCSVFSFIREALRLDDAWDAQREAYLELFQWFFVRWRGRAWISTVPLKRKSDESLLSYGARTIRQPYEDELRSLGTLSGRPSIKFPDFEPFPLKGFRFFYDLDGPNVRKEVFQYAKRKTVVYPNGTSAAGYDCGMLIAQRGVDDALLHRGVDVSVARAFYSETERLYRCRHIWLCKISEYTPFRTVQLCVRLHPLDGRTIALKMTRRSLSMALHQQALDHKMLQEARFFHGEEA